MKKDHTDIKLRPVGLIHTPFKEREDTPIQGKYAQDVEGRIEILPEFTEGLKDLDGFSHIILIYYFHRARGEDLTGRPYLDDEERGIFAIRKPDRPNRLGLTVVKLESIEGDTLNISGVDMLDGTPLLDIKPYVDDFDIRGEVRVGWLKDQLKREDKKNPRKRD
jgi:tRNA-Thr(GGU) m(6)t(6)A37 methyltransferase TsaA